MGVQEQYSKVLLLCWFMLLFLKISGTVVLLLPQLLLLFTQRLCRSRSHLPKDKSEKRLAAFQYHKFLMAWLEFFHFKSTSDNVFLATTSYCSSFPQSFSWVMCRWKMCLVNMSWNSYELFFVCLFFFCLCLSCGSLACSCFIGSFIYFVTFSCNILLF